MSVAGRSLSVRAHTCHAEEACDRKILMANRSWRWGGLTRLSHQEASRVKGVVHGSRSSVVLACCAWGRPRRVLVCAGGCPGAWRDERGGGLSAGLPDVARLSSPACLSHALPRTLAHGGSGPVARLATEASGFCGRPTGGHAYNRGRTARSRSGRCAMTCRCGVLIARPQS